MLVRSRVATLVALAALLGWGGVARSEDTAAASQPPPTNAEAPATANPPPPPPGIFMFPRVQPAAPQQPAEGPGCTFQNNKLELVV